jgi:hypothetical protein
LANVDYTAAYQRLASGHADLGDAARCRRARDFGYFLNRHDIFVTALLNAAFRHTVDAAEIA